MTRRGTTSWNAILPNGVERVANRRLAFPKLRSCRQEAGGTGKRTGKNACATEEGTTKERTLTPVRRKRDRVRPRKFIRDANGADGSGAGAGRWIPRSTADPSPPSPQTGAGFGMTRRGTTSWNAILPNGVERVANRRLAFPETAKLPTRSRRYG